MIVERDQAGPLVTRLHQAGEQAEIIGDVYRGVNEVDFL